MSLVCDVVPQLHLEGRTEEFPVRNGRCVVPHLDDVVLSLRRQRDADNGFIVFG